MKKPKTSSPSIQSTLICSGSLKRKKGRQANAEIRQINNEALCAGMSYGRYVAMTEAPERMKRRKDR